MILAGKMKYIIFLLLLCVMWPGKAFSLELYSFIGPNNATSSGLLINVTTDTALILNQQGQTEQLTISSIRKVYIYNTVHNPISQIRLNARLKKYFRKIHIDNSERVSFIGMPVQFIDDLVFFYDTSGNVHIHKLSQVTKLLPYKHNKEKKIRLKNYVSITLINEDKKPKETTKNDLYPTKILKGKIEIYEFLTKFRNGFRDFLDYQERTFLR